MESPVTILETKNLSFPKHRDAGIAFVAAIQQLTEAFELDVSPFSLVVNFHGPARRLDIARLSPDGMHIVEWLGALSLDPSNLDTFGTPASLPLPDGPTQ